MNAKILKQFRAHIRAAFGHLPERKLLQSRRTVMVPDYRAGLNFDGTPKLVPFSVTTTAVNDRNTQRGAYRLSKREAKRAV